jgi:hypothetical protein
MARVKIAVDGGAACFIHSDAAVALLSPLGTVAMRRASHVEPWAALSPAAQLAFYEDNGPDYQIQPTAWFADLSPVGGRTAGPFATKQEALDYEVAWINQNALTYERHPTDGSPA